jgi:hypothetical protein
MVFFERAKERFISAAIKMSEGLELERETSETAKSQS